MNFACRDAERHAVQDRLAGDGRLEIFNLQHDFASIAEAVGGER